MVKSGGEIPSRERTQLEPVMSMMEDRPICFRRRTRSRETKRQGIVGKEERKAKIGSTPLRRYKSEGAERCRRKRVVDSEVKISMERMN